MLSLFAELLVVIGTYSTELVVWRLVGISSEVARTAYRTALWADKTLVEREGLVVNASVHQDRWFNYCRVSVVNYYGDLCEALLDEDGASIRLIDLSGPGDQGLIKFCPTTHELSRTTAVIFCGSVDGEDAVIQTSDLAVFRVSASSWKRIGTTRRIKSLIKVSAAQVVVIDERGTLMKCFDVGLWEYPKLETPNPIVSAVICYEGRYVLDRGRVVYRIPYSLEAKVVVTPVPMVHISSMGYLLSGAGESYDITNGSRVERSYGDDAPGRPAITIIEGYRIDSELMNIDLNDRVMEIVPAIGGHSCLIRIPDGGLGIYNNRDRSTLRLNTPPVQHLTRDRITKRILLVVDPVSG